MISVHKLAVFSLVILSQFIIDIYHPPSNVVVFTPLHLYFMSPSGSDANDGLAPTVGGGHGPWQTPNHNVACGDVILAAAGDYSSAFTTTGLNFGTVSTCPSTTGGIDGTGGIWFATVLCAGSDLESCLTTDILWDMFQNNWSIQGWKVNHANICDGTFPSTACGSGQRAFELDGSGTPVHHFAIINNVCYGVASCVHAEDGGMPGTHGTDYVAAVGNIGTRASMNSPFPESAFDCVGMFPHDTLAGTHCYFYNNYTWNDDCGPNCDQFDSEAFMFDTWDEHAGWNNTGVVSNNISWNSKRFCVNFFTGDVPLLNTVTPTMKAYNNTCFNNLVAITQNEGADGEIEVQLAGAPWTVQINNNIMQNTRVQSGGGATTCDSTHCIPYAALSGGGFINGGLTWGTGANQNIMKGNAGRCNDTCDAGNNVIAFNSNPVPNGIYVDPGFNNTTDLLNNRSGNVPSCTGFINTTQCMGWNANTQVLTNPSVIYDLQPNPNCGSVTNQCVGKGFQLPSTTCASSGPLATDYPTWLKGMVYQHASGYTLGATITQNPDLATRRCGY